MRCKIIPLLHCISQPTLYLRKRAWKLWVGISLCSQMCVMLRGEIKTLLENILMQILASCKRETLFLGGNGSLLLHTLKGSGAEFSARGCSAAWHSDPVHIKVPIIVWKLEKRQYGFAWKMVKYQQNNSSSQNCMLLFIQYLVHLSQYHLS